MPYPDVEEHSHLQFDYHMLLHSNMSFVAPWRRCAARPPRWGALEPTQTSVRAPVGQRQSSGVSDDVLVGLLVPSGVAVPFVGRAVEAGGVAPSASASSQR